METNNQNLGDLLPINENNGNQAVNARNLHLFLEVGRDFTNWMKDQIERCDLVENQDYEVFAEKGENPKGGRPSKEYALSINAAKEISMMSQTEKGKQARRYFIACEEKLKEVAIKGYIPPQRQEQFTISQKFEAAEAAARFLNLNNIGKVRMAKAILDPLGIPVPEYLASSGHKLPARDLLTMHGIRMGSVAFNKIMYSYGLLVWHERRSMSNKSKVKKFAALTEKGLERGENADSIHSNLETQVLYYVDKFPELLRLLDLI
jgi:phage anti-repressor protein